MKLITDVKVMDFPGQSFVEVIAELYHRQIDWRNPPELIEEAGHIKTEIIRGTMFRLINQETVIIGASLADQEALSLPFEAFENMSNEVECQHLDNVFLRQRVKETQKAIIALQKRFNRAYAKLNRIDKLSV